MHRRVLRVRALDVLDLSSAQQRMHGREWVAAVPFETSESYRGAGDRYTFYYRAAQTCSAGGIEYVLDRAGIASGRVEPATGDLVDLQFMNVTLEVSQPLRGGCSIGGNGEQKGGWSMYQVDRMKRVSPQSLAQMCLDGSEAYIPTESWTDRSGSTCMCLPDLTAECGP
jgi:hypothetical protein